MGNTGQIEIHPENPEIIYAVSNHQKGIFFSRDTGSTWDSLPIPDGETAARNLTLDPRDPAHMFVQLKKPTDSWFDFDLYETNDTARTWTRIVDGFSYGGMIMDPHTYRLVCWGANGDKRTVSSPDGTTWELMDTTAFSDVRAYKPSPLSPAIHTLFRNEDERVLVSTDTMNTWFCLDKALPRNPYINHIEYHPSDTSLVFLIDNKRGLLKIDLDEITDDYLVATRKGLSLGPNRFEAIITGPPHARRIMLPAAGIPTRIHILDCRGRLVHGINAISPETGIKLPTLPPGMYLLNISVDTGTRSRQFNFRYLNRR